MSSNDPNILIDESNFDHFIKIPVSQEKCRSNKCIKFIHYGQDSNPPKKEEEIDLENAIKQDREYGKLMLNETKESREKNRSHLINDDYYSSTIKQEKIIKLTNLPEFNQMEDSELTTKVEEIYENLISNNPSLLERVHNELNNFCQNEVTAKVGPLVPCDNLKEIINVKENNLSKAFNELKTEIKSSRRVLNDGNSFYRAFMFSLIEHHILSQDLLNFNKCVVDFSTKSRKQFNQKDKTINTYEALIIFYMIYSNLKQGNIRIAYHVFLTAVNQSTNFDISLIKFMRIALAEYIEKNADKIFKHEHFEEIEAIAAPAYLNNHNFNYKDYINNRLLSFDYDADKFIVQISPAVFNVNLDLYAIEGTASDNQSIRYLKNFFHCLSDDIAQDVLSLFYHFCQFEILYSIKMISDNNEYITNMFNNTNVEKERFIIVNNNKECDTCKTSSDEICFKHIPQYNFCKNCVKDAMNQIMRKRIKFLSNDGYNNMGYYCRPIALSTVNSLYDQDFIALFDRNICQQLHHLLENCCSRCKEPLNEQYNTIPSCKCNLNDSCINQLILDATDNNVILNKYEEKNFKAKDVKCGCGQAFKIKEAIEVFYKDKKILESYIKKAYDRLVDAASVICAMCGKSHPTAKQSKQASMNTDTRKNDDAYVKLPISPSKNYEEANCTHILCKDCMKKYSLEIEKLIQLGKVKANEKYYPFNCNICQKAHQAEVKSFVSQGKKKNEGKACCIMF